MHHTIAHGQANAVLQLLAASPLHSMDACCTMPSSQVEREISHHVKAVAHVDQRPRIRQVGLQ